MDVHTLDQTARAIVAHGKGILAADESSGTIQKRLADMEVESTEANLRDYREMLFRTANIAQYISGIILHDETIRQNAVDGTPLSNVISDQGIIPGITVDMDDKPLAGAPDERVTEGLDGLRDRLAEYVELGARFTKWRAVIAIGSGIPTRYCLEANAHALARFAALSQQAGLVPIIEPDVLMDGGHNIDVCFEATEATLREVYYQLGTQHVALEGTLLKPNMVLSGKDASNRAGPEEIAEKTVTCFKRVVPAAVPGIVFLSGGQSDDESTVNLNAINQHASSVGAPWELSFSYGRALQTAPLKAWSGDPSNEEMAREVYQHRAHMTSAACQGIYKPEMEKELAAT